MSPFRIGVLGAARITPSPPSSRPPGALTESWLTAVAARDRSRAQALRDEARHRPRCTTPTTRCSPIRTSTRSTTRCPNGLHAEWTIAALEAGKHVLCEKPFTANTKEAEAVAAVAARTGLVVMEAFHYRYHPLAQRMRDIVDSGELGTIRRVETALCFPLPKFSDIRYQYDLARRRDDGRRHLHRAHGAPARPEEPRSCRRTRSCARPRRRPRHERRAALPSGRPAGSRLDVVTGGIEHLRTGDRRAG